MNDNQHILPAPQQIPIAYITTAAALGNCIAQLKQAKAIAFDLEFDRDHYTYGFNLCLMQIASDMHCYLIDPQADLDIRETFSLLEDPAILKVVHSSTEDMRLLHSLKCYPKNLCDTEAYAKLLNYERISLGAMIQQLFGIELDKKMQKVNWVLRPLKPQQMEYAANDVLYLLQMKTELERQGAGKGLLPFFEEENEQLSTTIYDMGSRDNFLKKSDLLYASPYQQYVLNGMFCYRDNLAMQQNKPAHYIMNEDTLRGLAANKISRAEWQDLKGLHPLLKSREGEQQVFEQLEKLKTEAHDKNLSHKRKRINRSAEDFQEEREKRDMLKATLFKPIQDELALQYGEHAMRFIFSTAMVNTILQGEMKIGEMKTAYRQMLVMAAAKKLGVSLSAYE